MKELIEIIIEDEELTRPEKQILVSKLFKASRNPDEYITSAYFLRSKVQENNVIDMKLWHIKLDNNSAPTYEPTNFDNYQIIEFMKKELLHHNKTK